MGVLEWSSSESARARIGVRSKAAQTTSRGDLSMSILFGTGGLGKDVCEHCRGGEVRGTRLFAGEDAWPLSTPPTPRVFSPKVLSRLDLAEGSTRKVLFLNVVRGKVFP